MPQARVLFVCVENSNRSQMAEAFARMHGAGVLEPQSAGSRPAEEVNSRAMAAMRERGYDLSAHTPKGLPSPGEGLWDYVITMGCGDECPSLPARHHEDWDLPDPRDMASSEFAAVRDEIERRVLDLIGRVKAEAAFPEAARPDSARPEATPHAAETQEPEAS